MLGKSSEAFSLEQHFEPKSFDVSLKVEGVEKMRSGNLRLPLHIEAIRFEFRMKLGVFCGR